MPTMPPTMPVLPAVRARYRYRVNQSKEAAKFNADNAPKPLWPPERILRTLRMKTPMFPFK
jgi:hypothetical protein